MEWCLPQVGDGPDNQLLALLLQLKKLLLQSDLVLQISYELLICR